jgi:hypothetical protein
MIKSGQFGFLGYADTLEHSNVGGKIGEDWDTWKSYHEDDVNSNLDLVC